MDGTGICDDAAVTVGECKMTMAVASYYAVWASCTWCLAYELSMVFCWLLRKRWEIPAEVFPIVLLLVGTAG